MSIIEKMKVKDKVKVLGRGCVIVVEPDCEINFSDNVKTADEVFEIVGIERWSHLKTTGLVLRPNDKAYETINIGDEIQIVPKILEN